MHEQSGIIPLFVAATDVLRFEKQRHLEQALEYSGADEIETHTALFYLPFCLEPSSCLKRNFCTQQVSA